MKLITAFLAAAGCAFAQRSVFIDWQANPTNPVATTTYNVYRAPSACDAAPAPVFTKISTAPLTERNYTDTSVAIGQTYCYRITAQVNNIESAPSNTAPAPIPPLPPNTVTITVQVIVTVDPPKP